MNITLHVTDLECLTVPRDSPVLMRKESFAPGCTDGREGPGHTGPRPEFALPHPDTHAGHFSLCAYVKTQTESIRGQGAMSLPQCDNRTGARPRLCLKRDLPQMAPRHGRIFLPGGRGALGWGLGGWALIHSSHPFILCSNHSVPAARHAMCQTYA